MTELIINSDFERIIPPLSTEEFDRLQESIASEGCRDPIVTWKGTIVDGHNRYKICRVHNIPFNVIDYSDRLATKDEVVDWMYSNQLARRNLTDDQSAYLRGRQYAHRKKMSWSRHSVGAQSEPLPNNHIVNYICIQ